MESARWARTRGGERVARSEARSVVETRAVRGGDASHAAASTVPREVVTGGCGVSAAACEDVDMGKRRSASAEHEDSGTRSDRPAEASAGGARGAS